MAARTSNLRAAPDHMTTPRQTIAHMLTAGTRKVSARAALLGIMVLAGSNHASATIQNTANAGGTYNSIPVVSNSVTVDVPVIARVATMVFDKRATFNDINSNGRADIGDTITYTFDVTNNGTVQLQNVLLTDSVVSPPALALSPTGDMAPTGDSTDTAASGWAALAPRDTLTTSVTYAITQTDIDAGEVLNTANVTSNTSYGATVTGTDSVTTTLPGSRGLTLDKEGLLALGPDGEASVGDLISYNFTVTNTGSVTLTNVSINDALLMAGLPNPERINELVQVAAIPADQITTASIAPRYLGPTPREPAQLQRDIPTIPTAFNVSRRLINLAGASDLPKVGDRVGVYFALTNTGDAPLTNISIIQPGDEAFGNALDILAPNTSDNASIIFTHTLTEEDVLTGQIDVTSGIIAHARGRSLVQTLRGPMSLLDMETPSELATAAITPATVSSLAPGASTVFTATYNLTQNDINAGQVSNTATAGADNTAETATDTEVVPVPRVPELTLDKTSSLNISSNNPQRADVGDVITYTFVLTNTGNVTVDNLRIVDAPLGISVPAVAINNFAPGATQTFTATYQLTATDVATHQVTNQATASGVYGPTTDRSPINQLSNDPATPAVNDSTVTPLPGIAIVKPVPSVTDSNANGYTDAGDVINYSFRLTNTGLTALTGVYVRDRDPAVVHNINPPTSITLAPGQIDTTTFTATYTLVQADVVRGYYDNTADAFGTMPSGAVVTDESDPLVPTAEIANTIPDSANLSSGRVETTADCDPKRRQHHNRYWRHAELRHHRPQHRQHGSGQRADCRSGGTRSVGLDNSKLGCWCANLSHHVSHRHRCRHDSW